MINSTKFSSFAILHTLVFCLLVLNTKVSAQLPVGLPTCTGYSSSLVYFISGNQIYNYDPCLPLSTTNPWANSITGAAGGDGLALGANIYAASPAVTFYVSGVGANSDYYWYNGTSWVASGYNSGNAAAVNPTASGNYLYNLVGFTGEVYQNTSTGNGTLLTTVAGFSGNGPFDLQGDGAGNWYILDNVAQYLREYNSAGTLINTWTLTGNPNTSTAGGGMGIIGNTLYFHVNVSPQFWKGVISGSTIACTPISAASLNPSPEDFATCPLGSIGSSGVNTIDTSYLCKGVTSVQLIATGNGPYTWTVISGPAVIVGNGDTVTATTTATSVIRSVATTPSTTCVSNIDTFLLVVPNVSVSAHAGLPDSIHGCGTYFDSLKASFTSSAAWINYHFNWTPAAFVFSGGTTLDPVIHPIANGLFFITITTDPSQGNCIWKDSVKVVVVDRTVNANFSDSLSFGCPSDTVNIFNVGNNRIQNYIWTYGDGITETSSSPLIHVYQKQGIYNLKLFVSNELCKDSLTKTLNTRHPLHADFSINKDSFCQEEMALFTNLSIDTVRNGIQPTFAWYFGDGSGSKVKNPTYTYGYSDTGNFTVMMIVQDFVPCYDTAYKIVEVFSKPKQYDMDSFFCNPNTTFPIGMEARYADTYLWSTGAKTPTIIPDTAGIYTVTTSNLCGSDVSSVKVELYNCNKCLFVPSAFTPNNDGLNDVFHVRQLCQIRHYGIKILNRFGQIVYRSYYINEGWDGTFNSTPADLGTYFYEINYTPDYPNAYEVFMKGDITLIR